MNFGLREKSQQKHAVVMEEQFQMQFSKLMSDVGEIKSLCTELRDFKEVFDTFKQDLAALKEDNVSIKAQIENIKTQIENMMAEKYIFS